MNASANAEKVAEVARDYYDSTDADSFYFHVWGGEDIHIGIYEQADESIFDASRRTVERLASKLELNADTRVLDLGAGYGGAARWLAKNHGCHVECLNLSGVQNERNRHLTAEQGLREKIGVTDGSFEEVPFEDASFDALWSQDAILHSGHKKKVFEEAARVMKPGARFVFTDPMQADDADTARLGPVLERIHLDHMGSPGMYEKLAGEVGLSFVGFDDLTPQLINHYSSVRRDLEARRDELLSHCSEAYLDRMVKGLGHWVAAGTEGLLRWGILTVEKAG
jgi:sarcosine/dimethylglycine N-methyltransferase